MPGHLLDTGNMVLNKTAHAPEEFIFWRKDKETQKMFIKLKKK